MLLANIAAPAPRITMCRTSIAFRSIRIRRAFRFFLSLFDEEAVGVRANLHGDVTPGLAY
jgi:hypothetical protein